MSRLRAKRDANEPAILASCRSIPGFEAITLPPDPKKRLADLLVRGPMHAPGVWTMVEVKVAKGKLQDHQEESRLRGHSIVVRNLDDMLRVLGIGGGRVTSSRSNGS